MQKKMQYLYRGSQQRVESLKQKTIIHEYKNDYINTTCAPATS